MRPLSDKARTLEYDTTPWYEHKNVDFAIKMLKEEDETFEAKVTGLVWRISYNTDFDIKYFNNKILELIKERNIKINEIFGSFDDGKN